MFSRMEDQRAVDVADFGDLLQVKIQHGIAIHRQQFVTGGGITVFFQNPQRKIQQGDFKLHHSFPPCTPDPPCAILREMEVLPCQQAHVPVRDAGVAGEQEQVADMVEGLPVKRGGHYPLQFLCREISPYGFRSYRFISGKRVGGDDTVRDSLTDDGSQPDGQVDDGPGSETALRP